MFLIKKLLTLLLLPPLAPLIVTTVGLLMLGRWPRFGRMIAWLGLASAIALSTPSAVDALLRKLEDIPPVSTTALRDAQAIVILAGGARANAPEFGGQTINRITLERVRYGARLAHQTGLPLLVTGGAPSGGAPEAELMQDALKKDFGLAARWVEARSLDTRENAQFSAKILHQAGVERIVLVTHAAHMRRSQESFEAAGLKVIPAPTAYFGHGGDDEPVPRLPNMNAAYAGAYAVHEWLGLIAYRLSR